MRRAGYGLCGFLLISAVHGCGDDGAPAEGTSTGEQTTTAMSTSSSSSSTGDESSTTAVDDSTTMSQSEDTGTPINCGAQVCDPQLVCVREETPPGGTSSGPDTESSSSSSSGSDSGNMTSSSGDGGMGGGVAAQEFFCRGRPDECDAGVADCSCAAILCPANACECIDEGTNAIACVPGPSC
jgi:hypothetical protein